MRWDVMIGSVGIKDVMPRITVGRIIIRWLTADSDDW